MARPKPDIEATKARLIAEAEAVLLQTDGRKLVLSDLARRLGMSQSHVHSFFPTKADLVRSLAQKWFRDVERVSRQAARSDAAPAERLESWVLSILRLKRDRFDQNPKLFLAYLELARDHMDLVEAHVLALRDDLALIVRDMVPDAQVAPSVRLIEDATLLFRTPQNIASYRSRATDAAARSVCKVLTAHLANIARG